MPRRLVLSGLKLEEENSPPTAALNTPVNTPQKISTVPPGSEYNIVTPPLKKTSSASVNVAHKPPSPPPSPAPAHSLSSKQEKRMTWRLIEEVESTCFLSLWLPGRMQVRDVGVGRSVDIVIKEDGNTFELLTIKLASAGLDFLGRKKQSHRLYYVKTSGCGVPTISLREELEKIAGFRSEPSTVRKVAARLEHLVSPSASHRALKLQAENFELIPEPSGRSGNAMSDGCGFIPEMMLLMLTGGGTGALKAARTIIKSEGLKVKMNVTKERTLYDIVNEIDAARRERGSGSESCVSEVLRVAAIQVRIMGPGLGVVKGMLVRRQGISQIQVPPSMLKKGRPTTGDKSRYGNDDDDDDDDDNDNDDSDSDSDSDWVTVIVSGLFPSRTNTTVGSLLAQQAKKAKEEESEESEEKPVVAPKSFVPKELSAMFTRLWEAWGVPPAVIARYTRRVRGDSSSVAHAWLVGVADPTGALPPGHLFITGAEGTPVVTALQSQPVSQSASSHAGAVFITRAPAIKASDGRLLPVVAQRPEGMSAAQWRWLQLLPFGAVVFSTADTGDSSSAGGVPLASTVADGDLDGDLYLVCWEPAVLQHLSITTTSPGPGPGPRSRDINQTSSPHASVKQQQQLLRNQKVLLAEDNKLLSHDDSWLRQVQTHLTAASTLGEIKLVRLLFRSMQKVQEEKGYDHPDALALGAAYVQMLERAKHGRVIALPEHLHALIIKKL